MEHIQSVINDFSLNYFTPLLFLVGVLLFLNAATFYRSRNHEGNQIIRLFKKYKKEGVVMIRPTEKTDGINTYILETNNGIKKVCVNRFGKIKELKADGTYI